MCGYDPDLPPREEWIDESDFTEIPEGLKGGKNK